MQTISYLWLPILVAAAFVFIGSTIVWMILPHHKTEWSPAPGQDVIQNAFKGASPGLYAFPMAQDPKDRRSPEAMKKWQEGPSGHITLVAAGGGMSGMMVKWVIFNIVVATFAGYVAGHSFGLGPVGPSWGEVFRVVGAVGFMTYGLSAGADAIWFGKPVRSFVLQCADGLFYGALMALAFGWLWPRG